MIKSFTYVFIGCGLGGCFRYFISTLTPLTTEANFPYPTLLANLIACLIAGLLIGQFQKIEGQAELSLLLITGFCGGLSTFSAFSVEGLGLIKQGNYTAFTLYLSMSILFGILAVLLGLSIANKI